MRERTRDLAALQNLLGEWGSTQKSLTEAQDAYRAASAAAEAASRNYQEKNRAFLDAQAGILAQNLCPETPCPVCGSLHHPSPAAMPQSAPTETELEEAKRAEAQARRVEREQSGRSGELAALAWAQESSLLEGLRRYVEAPSLPEAKRQIDECLYNIRQEREALRQSLLDIEAQLSHREALEGEVRRQEERAAGMEEERQALVLRQAEADRRQSRLQGESEQRRCQLAEGLRAHLPDLPPEEAEAQLPARRTAASEALRAVEERQREADGRIAEIREEIAFLIGDVNIGANASTSAFKNYLYKDLGLPVLKTTAKYQEAADDEAMILLADWCRENRPELVRLFELVQEYRRIGKIRSTYLDGYLRHVNQATGRIHPDLMPLGTETGRFSARNPNLQNMPRKGSDPVGIRRLFVAPPGCAVMELDYSQVELRVGAFYCRDGKMLETYRGGGDIHAQTTSVIYHIPVEQAADKNGADYKERRSIAKNCNFGCFYGLFPRGLQKTLKFKAGLDTTLKECEAIIANLKSGYPGLTRWQEATKRQAAARRYSETWLGRRRYLPGIVSEDWGKKSFAERCAMNTPIQGTAADIIKLAMGRIVAVLPEYPWIQPVLTVHDSLVFYVPEGKVEEAGRLIKGLMEKQPFAEFDVPLVAEVAAGVNYGEMDEW